jgi:hypothetical protein
MFGRRSMNVFPLLDVELDERTTSVKKKCTVVLPL